MVTMHVTALQTQGQLEVRRRQTGATPANGSTTMGTKEVIRSAHAGATGKG